MNLAAIESARGLAWTALVLALFLPPVGIGVGWFCLGIARRTGQFPGSGPAARRLGRIATAALVLGVVSLGAWVALLVVAAR